MKIRIVPCTDILAASCAHASALYFYETDTKDTALAGARAQDASTIMTNPAGMAHLPNHRVTGGLQVIITRRITARSKALVMS